MSTMSTMHSVYGNIDFSARKINQIQHEEAIRNQYKHLETVKNEFKALDKLSAPTVDMAKLKQQIKKCHKYMDEPFPQVRLHEGEDMSKFTKARYEQQHVYSSNYTGVLCHDSEDAFTDTCNVIATTYNVDVELVKTAIWLSELHYTNAETKQMVSVDSFYDAYRLFGLVSKKAFKFMCDHCDDYYLCDYARLSQLLQKD